MNSGRVGDVPFLDDTGRYRWIRNAFDVAITLSLSLFLTIKKRLERLQWPLYQVEGEFIDDNRAVTTNIPPHFRIAIGGDFSKSHKAIDLGAEIPLSSAST